VSSNPSISDLARAYSAGKKLEIGTRLPQIKFRALILGGVQRRVAKLLKFVLDVLGHRMNSIQRSYCFGGCAETIPD